MCGAPNAFQKDVDGLVRIGRETLAEDPF